MLEKSFYDIGIFRTNWDLNDLILCPQICPHSSWLKAEIKLGRNLAKLKV